MLFEFLNKLFKNRINNSLFNVENLNNSESSVFKYDFMMSLDEKHYPKYLKQAYLIKMKKPLNLKSPKTFKEKIQWLKLYDNIPVKTTLTDKVMVRDWIKEKIGSEYLKTVYQICDRFDDIEFNNLPESFVIKCNHGCKWMAVVKHKEEFLSNNIILKIIKKKFYDWMQTSFFGRSDFELQYKNIVPKIIIEEYLSSECSEDTEYFQIFCFNSIPKIFQRRKRDINDIYSSYITSYDENYNQINLKFIMPEKQIDCPPSEKLKKAVELSKTLAKDFKFVRVDWMFNKGRLYFEEMTFTPFSGLYVEDDEYKPWTLKLGNMLNLKGN